MCIRDRWYNIVLFVLGIPGWLASLVKAVGNGIAGAFRGIRNELTDCATTFTRGSWKTKVSYLVMGFGNIARGQVLRGLLFLVFESVFIVYMVTTGSYWLGKFRTLGDVPPGEVYNEVPDTYVRVNGCLLYTSFYRRGLSACPESLPSPCSVLPVTIPGLRPISAWTSPEPRKSKFWPPPVKTGGGFSSKGIFIWNACKLSASYVLHPAVP